MVVFKVGSTIIARDVILVVAVVGTMVGGGGATTNSTSDVSFNLILNYSKILTGSIDINKLLFFV